MFIVTIAAVCIMGTPRWLIEEVRRWCNIIGVDFRSIKKIEVKPYVKFGGKTVILPNGGFVLRINELLLKDRDVVRAVVIHELVHMRLKSRWHNDKFYSMLFTYIDEEEYWRLYERMNDVVADHLIQRLRQQRRR